MHRKSPVQLGNELGGCSQKDIKCIKSMLLSYFLEEKLQFSNWTEHNGVNTHKAHCTTLFLSQKQRDHSSTIIAAKEATKLLHAAIQLIQSQSRMKALIFVRWWHFNLQKTRHQ